MRVGGSSPSNRTRVPVFFECYSAGTFYLILVIPGSFNTMLRSISYRKQQGFVSRVSMQRSYNGECASLPSWRCGFDSHSLLHAARQDSFAHQVSNKMGNRYMVVKVRSIKQPRLPCCALMFRILWSGMEVVLLGESGVQVYLIYMRLWWNRQTRQIQDLVFG